MKFDEFVVLAKSIKMCYPRGNMLETDESVEIWYSFLSDLEYKTASIAVQKYVKLNAYPPTIADIRKEYADIVCGSRMSGTEAWSLVLNALKKVEEEGCARKRYDELPKTIQSSIGGYPQFLEWAEKPVFNNGYAKTDFLRSYSEAMNRDIESARLDPSKWIAEHGEMGIEEK